MCDENYPREARQVGGMSEGEELAHVEAPSWGKGRECVCSVCLYGERVLGRIIEAGKLFSLFILYRESSDRLWKGFLNDQICSLIALATEKNMEGEART